MLSCLYGTFLFVISKQICSCANRVFCAKNLLCELNLLSFARPYSQELLCGSTSTSQATEPWDNRFLRKVDVPTNQPTNQRANRGTSTCKKGPIDVPRSVSHPCVTGSLGSVKDILTVTGIALTLTSFLSRLKAPAWAN